MRKDPPVDVDYLHATWILDHARGKTLLVNDPRGLRELNEHLAVLQLPAAHAADDRHALGRAAARVPARAGRRDRRQAGRRLRRARHLRRARRRSERVVDPRDLDRRRHAVDARAAVPARGRAGRQADHPRRRRAGRRGAARARRGRGARQPARRRARREDRRIDARDREIIATVAPFLRQHGQILVGLDVIGGMLTEINITSPTGVRHIVAARGSQRRRADPRLLRAHGPRRVASMSRSITGELRTVPPDPAFADAVLLVRADAGPEHRRRSRHALPRARRGMD